MTNPSRKPFSPVLTTDADVTAMWRTLINPLGWHTHRIYLILVGADRRAIPHLTEIDEIPDRFTHDDSRALMELYARLIRDLEPDGSLAVLVCRPGSASLTDDDRTCCRGIDEAAREAAVPLELLHVGTDTAIVPVPLDELLPKTA